MVQQLHIFFFPFLAHGHMLPSLDMAKVFISRGIKATMITTHYHVPMFEKAIERSKELGFDISVRAIKFPSSDSGLPEGIESFDQLKSDDLLPTFILATTKLQEQLEQLLEECRPHCIVADMFFPWATEAAAKFDIPRLVFGGTSTFAMSAMESLRRNRPYDHVSSDSEPFVVPEIPHEIKMTRGEISVFERQRDEQDTDLTRLFNRVRESDVNCYGVVVNSFYELEKDYIEYYTKKLGRKAWHIGPFLLCNKEVEDKQILETYDIICIVKLYLNLS
ncbi:OLC1v1003331C1 [Oldenlandia corymbosa var. corymbosa]|uniref:OLC1v1003331C1 n=1 Tax=Oldenlandia corymbosa var. corymbosa TaxID=529605 RepID=A0AAV1DC63_OLDCO|nr:OLC1v1003331C1 [Oldenlandia corymbosa var. corymbosa]